MTALQDLFTKTINNKFEITQVIDNEGLHIGLFKIPHSVGLTEEELQNIFTSVYSQEEHPDDILEEHWQIERIFIDNVIEIR